MTFKRSVACAVFRNGAQSNTDAAGTGVQRSGVNSGLSSGAKGEMNDGENSVFPIQVSR